MSKQTAVEWLVDKLKSQGLLIGEPDKLVAVNQAKRMEMEQREKDFVAGYKNKAEMSNSTFDEISEDVAKELFNQTFKTQNP